MKAVCWYGTTDVRVENVPDPTILSDRDAIIKITLSAICGSDLHLYDGYIPTMEKGDILGHEFMGEVVAVGKENIRLKEGDRVVIPFNLACGQCFFCRHDLWSLCDNSNPNARMAEKMYGYSASGLFGYSHLFGGYAGGQAEYVRVPFADVGALVIPEEIPDEKVLFLGDILSTAYMAALNCDVKPGDTVAVWGCGPVGQLTIKCLYMLGAERVIAIDNVADRLTVAHREGGAETLDFDDEDIHEKLKEMTGGRGPDACVDAVGMEAHGGGFMEIYDKAKQAVRLETDRPHVLRQAIVSCRKGGTVSIPGVYGGFIDKMPMGSAFSKGLTFKMGQTHVHKFMRPLLEKIAAGEIDPSYIITHRCTLDEAPKMYETFKNKEDNCLKVVLTP